jgi:hypothetical protein
MLAKFHIHWASVTFSKKILTRMRYMMKKKKKFIKMSCVSCNGESVVTINLNLIYLFIIQNCKNWVQKQISCIIFVKGCPNCPQNEILHICHLIY